MATMAPGRRLLLARHPHVEECLERKKAIAPPHSRPLTLQHHSRVSEPTNRTDHNRLDTHCSHLVSFLIGVLRRPHYAQQLTSWNSLGIAQESLLVNPSFISSSIPSFLIHSFRPEILILFYYEKFRLELFH